MPSDGGVVDSATERLVRIETKLDAALASQADHESRLRRVEFGTIAAIVISTVAVGTRIADIAGVIGK
jgi:hypothetical protein